MEFSIVPTALCHLLPVILILGLIPQAEAQPVPDRDPSSDLGTQVVTESAVRDRITGGTRPALAPNQPGPNLFHSFEAFGIPEGKEVFFEAAPGLENIFTRVVGDAPSTLSGTLGIENSNANLFLLNPNGILFGNNARLDLKGAFWAAAADSFTFADGQIFGAVQPDSPPPLLSMNIQPGLQFGTATPSLTASTLQKTGGALTLAAGGKVELDRYQGSALNILARGNVNVRAIDTRNSNGSGDVAIAAGGNINLKSYGAIRTSARPDAIAPAGDVMLKAGGDITLEERFLVQARAYGEGAGGDINLEANALTLNNRTQLDTSTRGQANGGNISLNVADALTLRGTNTRILSLVEPGAVGNGGSIKIQAGSVAITNGAGIYSGVRGQGNGGNISLNVLGPVVLDGTGGGSASAIVSTVFGNGTGDAGDIRLNAGSLSLVDGGIISLQLTPASQGNAGDLAIAVTGDILISGADVDKTLPDAELENPPVVGKVDVFFLADNTSSMRGLINSVRNNASDVLDSLTETDSRFEDVDIGFGVGSYVGDALEESTPPRIAYQLRQPISTDAGATEIGIQSWQANNGGQFNLRIPEGNFFALQQISTSGKPTESGITTEYGTGWRSGTDRVIIWFGDSPSFETTVSQGEAIRALVNNDIRVAAINTEKAGAGIDTNSQASAIATATGGSLRNDIDTSGVADTILTAVDEALFPDYATVNSSISGNPFSSSSIEAGGFTSSGRGGNVAITAQNLLLNQDGELRNVNFGPGEIGAIAIEVQEVIELRDRGGIVSSSIGLQGGPTGSLTIDAEQLTLKDRSAIVTDSFGAGSSGSLVLRVRDSIDLVNQSKISTQAFLEGNSGDIQIETQRLMLGELSEISSNTIESGTGGSIRINASESVEIRRLSTLFSGSLGGDSQAGEIALNTQNLVLESGGRIEAGTSSTAPAGAVTLTAENVFLDGNVTLTEGEFLAIALEANPLLETILETPGVTDDLATILGTAFSDPELEQSLRTSVAIIEQDRNSPERIFIPSGISSSTAEESTGSGSNLTLNVAEQLTITNGAELTGAALGSGDGGSILVTARDLSIGSAGRIISRAEGRGVAGGIDLQVGDRLTLSAGEISSSSEQSGGGDLNIKTETSFLENGSLLSSSVFDSTGGGGNITIDSDIFVTIQDSDILANAIAGPGGNITINSDTFLASLFVSGKATPVGRNPGPFSTFRGNERVDISADSLTGLSGLVEFPNLDPARGINELPESLPDNSDKIDRSCNPQELRREVGQSSFVITGRRGIPFIPGEPTPYFHSATEWLSLPMADTGNRFPASFAQLRSQPVSAKQHQPLQEASNWSTNTTGRVVLFAKAMPIPPQSHLCAEKS